MLRILLVVCLLASPLFAATAAFAQAVEGGILSGSLIEALNSVDKPELAGVFTYIAGENGPRAFADLIARDLKAMKRYTNKLADDLKIAKGLAPWDHQVCATLVTYYAGVAMPGIKKPDAKRIRALNECVLSPVVELAEITTRRNK